MFTQNWYKALAAVAAYDTATVSYTGLTGNTYKIGGTTGEIIGIGRQSTNAAFPTIYYIRTDFTSNGGVVLGTGTTQPTFNDYKLSGDLITTLNYTTVVTKEALEDGVKLTANYTITNIGEEAFTIGEIALMACLYGSNTAEARKAIIERTVLDSPVTIPAGGVGQVTYTINLRYPTE